MDLFCSWTSDVQGNVRALKYTLDHPLVFRDHEVRLDKQQKPYEPFTKVDILTLIVVYSRSQ